MTTPEETSKPVDVFVEQVGELIEKLDEETGAEVRVIKVNRVFVDPINEKYGRRISVVKSIEVQMS